MLDSRKCVFSDVFGSADYFTGMTSQMNFERLNLRGNLNKSRVCTDRDAKRTVATLRDLY
jgi:hypothetical protein